ncbi:D-amino-acid oxidase [Mycena venus]|uniref:D-amino-acid oxidase n=1 Tax=Mycena venus TaxID=2733690 RepID=A0A8H7CSC2_9AGAR|nr:D-amino-acid oxidase [Mycena venus]
MGSDSTIFVVGAGVIGLSTAIRALEAGFNVTIFAEIFPGDEKSIKYTSCWAGANHISVASTNALLHQLERETLPAFLELIEKDRLVPVMVRPHKEHARVLRPEGQKQMDHISQFYSDFRTLEPSELPEGVVHGGEFSTILVDVPNYLPYLMNRFLSSGGRAFRMTLPSLSALISEKDHVSDTNVYPTRGEVLIIRAPWIRYGMSYYYEDGHISYIIPRQSGDAILGGTFQVDDWHPTSRPETVQLIKERGIAAYPELLPEDKRESRNIADLDVLEECVGLRPTRKGGVRLEVASLNVDGKSVPIVHNYGHGGAGYQASWGSARFAVDLLKSVRMGKDHSIFVVGAGVAGLSTAIRALQAGYDVTIFAETFPDDKKSIKYTSCWAGAVHLCTTTDPIRYQMEQETLSVFKELMKEDPLVPVMVRPHKELAQVFGQDRQEELKILSQRYPDFRTLEPSELPEGVVHGAIFSTIFIDVPRYLSYLTDRFLALGGRAYRVTLPSLSALLSEKDRPPLTSFPPTSTITPPSFNPAAVINCTGIGALSIGDVLDTNVYPIRGEVLLIRAPWIHHSMVYYYEDGHISYVLPRQSGDVVLGGTFQVDDWHPTSRPETVKLIKERGIAAYPELLPPHKRENPNIADLNVLEEGVGLRPTRKGGVRVEITSLNLGDKSVPVVHNYGHGGAGFQSSWGYAEAAVNLLKSTVKK